jgi:hypothetical protein
MLTRNGWQVQETPAHSAYAQKLFAIYKSFDERGLTPNTPVWIASLPPQDYLLRVALQPETAGPTPRTHVCETFAWVAADRLAQGSHEIASEEQIAQFRREDAARAEVCKAQEMASRGQQSLVLTEAFRSAMSELGPTPRKKG